MKEKVASVIRIISVPPVMALLLILILFIVKKEQFASFTEIIVLAIFLGIFPILAYPFQKLLPGFREGGRGKQRKLAFIFTLIGYTGAALWSEITHCNRMILLITLTYFFSILILTVLNKVVYFKASGHASSLTAPIILLTFLIDCKVILPGIAIAAAVCWSSIYLKRHTFLQFFGGVLTACMAFCLALVVITL